MQQANNLRWQANYLAYMNSVARAMAETTYTVQPSYSEKVRDLAADQERRHEIEAEREKRRAVEAALEREKLDREKEKRHTAEIEAEREKRRVAEAALDRTRLDQEKEKRHAAEIELEREKRRAIEVELARARDLLHEAEIKAARENAMPRKPSSTEPTGDPFWDSWNGLPPGLKLFTFIGIFMLALTLITGLGGLAFMHLKNDTRPHDVLFGGQRWYRNAQRVAASGRGG